MAGNPFDIDATDDYGDETAARVIYTDDAYDSSENATVQPSRLRKLNWIPSEQDEKEYAAKVVRRKGVSNVDEKCSDSPDEDALQEWSDAESFGSSTDAEESETKELEEPQDTIADNEPLEENLNLFKKEKEVILEKGTHVRNQKLIWESCLENQIHTKRLLSSFKRIQNEDEAPSERTKECIDTLYECIDTMNELETILSSWNSESPSLPLSKTPETLWEETMKAIDNNLPEYNSILSAALQKTALMNGKAVKEKKFKAVHQDILSQVDAVIADPLRVKRKAHIPKDDAIVKEGNELELDELMYDDAEFYQHLLKEYIDQNTEAGGWQAALRLRINRKKRKLVNRKASKGRQIRYVVHPKLENFMFPEPHANPSMDIDELFRSLFGQQRSESVEAAEAC
uniref:Uncharacterized protein AlNc14C5G775 n=1 Tax=Albugo laibachii Nc14 TaxID=890382 RepID=F0W0Z5_9STRA|nr:conserved hypothetical protein [Albugo laibachii Nc14]|eukprot:CCA14719.1 conserved hypothetical protein [Albugo laibachii Nc14]